MTIPTTPTASNATSAKALNISLWFVHGLRFRTFAGTGVWMLLAPVADLAATFPWMGQVPVAFMRATGVVDLLGGLGVLWPAITRAMPGLTVWAALGCALLQVAAIVFHVSRGEVGNTPFNLCLVGLPVFVAWGRGMKVPIERRA